MERRDFEKRRLFIQYLTVAVGILLSIVAFLYAKDRSDRHFKQRFQINAETRASILITSMSYSRDEVEMLGCYYDLSGLISRKDFTRFTSPHIINDNCILAFEWVPAVPAASRRLYEEEARNDGFGYFRIWERDPDGKAIEAGERNIYYPIYYKYPDDYDRNLLGFDVGADPKTWEIFGRVRDSGKTTATYPFIPIEYKNRQYAFLVIRPVYFKGASLNTVMERRRHFKGFVVGVFGAGNLVESALRNTPPVNMPFDIFDMSVSGGMRLLHHGRPGTGPEKWSSLASLLYPDYPKYIKMFSFAGREYMIAMTAGPIYIRNNYSLNYYLIPFIGIILTLFASFYIRSVFLQREKADALINQRTMELSESRQLFRTVFQYSGIGIAMLDTEGNYLEVNRTFSSIVGYSMEELVTMNFRDITFEEDIMYQNMKMQEILDGAIDTYSMEKRYVCKNGDIIWVLMNVSIIRSEGGFPRYFISHLYDVTDRKRTVDKLIASEARYEQVVSMISDIIWRYEIDAQGVFVSSYISPVADRLLMQPPGTVANSFDKYFSYIHPEDLPAVKDTLLSLMAKSDEEMTAEYRMQKPDGALLWVCSSGSAHVQPDGHVVGFGSTADITERKKAEIALLEYRDHLEELVSERTLELEEKNLKLASEIDDRRRAEDALKESEKRFRTLFESSPTPMWVEDFSPVKRYMDDLKAAGVTDLRKHLEENRDEVARMASMVKVLDINQASLDDLEACGLADSSENMSKHFNDVSVEVFREELVKLSEGQTSFDCEMSVVNAKGNEICYHVYIKVWPGHEDDLSMVMLTFYNVTERKRIEEEVRNSGERLRLIIENSNDIFVLLDRGGSQTYISPIVERLTGYKADELISKPFNNVIYPEDLDYVNEAWRKCLENPGTEVRLTYRHIHKEKGYVWFEAIITNYLDNPAVCAVVDNVRDITDRKQIEEALKESEAKYRFLVDNMSDVLWTADLNMNTTYVSPSIAQMGFTPEERTRQKIEEQMTPGSMRKCRDKMLEEMAREGQPDADKDRVVVVEIEQYMKDGSTRFFEHRIKPLRNENGDMTGLQGIGYDIHERKQAEEYIRKLSGAVEESMATIVIANREGIIEYVNPSFVRNTGYSAEEAIGKDIGMTNPDIHPDRIHSEILKIIRTGREWKGEVCTRKKSGELFWEYASISPIHNETGEITHFVAVREDISQRKRMEAELFKAKEAAEAANRAKSSFLANMSHELRTPLNAIIGFSQVLKEDYYGRLNERQLKFVDDIEKGGYHLLTLINDILDLSKIEAGNIQLDLKQFSISELARTSMTVIEQKASKHAISLVYDCAPNVRDMEVIADEIKIKQVLYNLLSNASKFTPDGGEISMKLKRDDKMVYVTVTDTGIGIEPRYADRIFEPFFQVMGEHQEKFRGTGLGMSISRQIIEMHGGGIWVESEGLGKGSSFTFSLPVRI